MPREEPVAAAGAAAARLSPGPLSPGHPLRRLESLYNPIGQQRGGLLWELLKAVPGRGREHPVLRSLSHGAFNTNPVLAGYLAGALAAELARDPGERDPAETEERVDRFRSLLAPVLASVADRIIWGGLRPVLTLLGILAALLRIGEPAVWYWVGYNSVQFYWRRRSWRVGLRGEEAVRGELRARVLERWASNLARAGRFLLGLALGVALAGLWVGQGAAVAGSLLLACAVGFVLMWRGWGSPLRIAWMGILLAGCLAGAKLVLERGVH